MYRAKKPLLCDLNEHLICKLCKGYFVDATTIIECLHTFCRSCIVKYLGTTKYCPVCDVQVHKSKPLLSLRQDKIIQDVVHKLVPRLYHNELRQRKEFHKKHPETKLSASEESFEASCGLFLIPEEELSVTLTYYGSLGKPRYLRCPSAVSVMVLQKLIRAKFDLSDSHHVDILHNQDCLSPLHTLMDIMYIYKLSKLEPLDLTYRIYEYMAKKAKLENQECKSEEQTDLTLQTATSNNNNWKEVQLRISENGEMSITGIQDDITSQSFSNEMMEVLDAMPKSPIVNTTTNPVKKKETPEIKSIGKQPQSSKCINILSDTILRPHSIEHRMGECLLPNISNNGVCNVISPVSVPSMNSSTTTVFTTVNSIKCSVESSENKTESKSVEVKKDNSKEVVKESYSEKNVQRSEEKIPDKGVKRKFDHLNNEGSKKITNSLGAKKIDTKTFFSHVLDVKNITTSTVDTKTTSQKTEEILTSKNNNEMKSNDDKTERSEVSTKKRSCTETDEKITSSPVTTCNTVQNNVKTTLPSREVSYNCNSNNVSKEKEAEVDLKSTTNDKNSSNSNMIPSPKPSTKYQGGSQPCYMPKTTFNPVLNIPKLHQSTITKIDQKLSSKAATSAKSEVKNSCPPSSSSSNPATSNSSSATKQKLNTKLKSNAPIGYKTLKDPPKSWNSQISKANLNKAQPDPKYSDLKNVRPAKFFKMRNNMLRFLGNPASGVKPMYSVHPNSDQEKPQEKVVENREIKKHSIVKIDPKTLKPISEKAPETTSLSSQVSTMADLKINTSSVSIFNPLKLQSNSPKSDRKSPKSPQSPRHKSSPSPSPPVKRDKPNLNFTPPNPFIPNLSSQTANPNQFLCNPGPPGFPSYDPRVMAAYHNLFYGPTMGFAPNPLSYHLGGLDITQRGKGFDISKIVGLQQQASSSKSPSSPQGTSKLDVPLVPPQVPYQPRPNPMSSRSPNVTSVTKRSHKDLSKNEKSLQNTVEKLTLSRAKEIHRAAEALSKLNSTDNNRQIQKKNIPEDNRASRLVNASLAKEKQNETKTSQAEENPTTRVQHNQNADSRTSEEKKATDSSNSESSDKRNNQTSSTLQKDSNNPKESSEQSKKDENSIESKSRPGGGKEKDNVDNSVKKSIEQRNCVNNTDETLGKSGDLKKKDDNVKEIENKAGSEKLDEVAGDN